MSNTQIPKSLISPEDIPSAYIRESEERYRAFIKQSSEGIWRFELDRPISIDLDIDKQIELFYKHATLAECNDQMARMYGYEKAGDIMGMRSGDFLPASNPRNVGYLQAFIRSGYRLIDAESEEPDKYGEPRHFLNNLEGIIENGLLVRAWGTRRDITDRKKSELQLIRRIEQINSICNLNSTIARAVSLEEIYQECLKAIVSIVQVDRASVLLFDDDGVMRFKASFGLSQDYRKAVEGHTPWQRGDKTAAPILVPDVEKDDKLHSYAGLFRREGIRALGFIPLLSPSGVIGKFMVYHNTPHVFTVDETRLIETIANHVAFALERTRREREIQKAHTLLKAIFEGTADAVYVKDAQGRYLMINAAGAQAVDKAPEDFMGKDDQHIFSPETASVIQRDDQRIMASGIAQTIEDKTVVDGITRYFLSTKNVYRDANGNVAGVIGISRDITERKRAEERLQESEEKFRRLVETTSVIPWEADASTGVFTYIGPQAARILGYPLEEWYGKTFWQDHIHLEDRERAVQFCIESSQKLPAYEFEYRMLAADGRTLWLRHIVAVIPEKEGLPKMLRGFLIDITSYKKAEQTLTQQAEELYRSNKELEQFAYVSSHDLKEPLRKISSYAELFSIINKGKMGAESDKYIEYIRDGVRRMQELIDDLLAYSKSGRAEMNLSKIDLNVVLKKVLFDLEKSIDESHATIGHSMLPQVMADASQIQLVFQNLISNAIKFHGGKPPRIQISAHRKHGEWILSVEDNGIGFEPKYRDQIFKVFQRLHNQKQYPGTGIGLAICKKIVERHGGRIWADAKPGKGSQFFFTFPK